MHDPQIASHGCFKAKTEALKYRMINIQTNPCCTLPKLTILYLKAIKTGDNISNMKEAYNRQTYQPRPSAATRSHHHRNHRRRRHNLLHHHHHSCFRYKYCHPHRMLPPAKRHQATHHQHLTLPHLHFPCHLVVAGAAHTHPASGIGNNHNLPVVAHNLHNNHLAGTHMTAAAGVVCCTLRLQRDYYCPHCSA